MSSPLRKYSSVEVGKLSRNSGSPITSSVIFCFGCLFRRTLKASISSITPLSRTSLPTNPITNWFSSIPKLDFNSAISIGLILSGLNFCSISIPLQEPLPKIMVFPLLSMWSFSLKFATYLLTQTTLSASHETYLSFSFTKVRFIPVIVS